jgi:hypothetical protein
LNERSREPEDDGPSGRELVIAAIEEVLDPEKARLLPDLDDAELTDVLLDHFMRFESQRFGYLAWNIAWPLLHTVAREALLREYLIMEPDLVAEQATLQMIAEVVRGRRVRPFPRFASRLVAQVLEWGRYQTRMQMHQFERNQPLEARRAATYNKLLNRLSASDRPVVWLLLVDQLHPDEISRKTGRPLAEVESVLVTFFQQVMELTHRSEMTPDDAGSAGFWRAMEPEDGDEQA